MTPCKMSFFSVEGMVVTDMPATKPELAEAALTLWSPDSITQAVAYCLERTYSRLYYKLLVSITHFLLT